MKTEKITLLLVASLCALVLSALVPEEGSAQRNKKRKLAVRQERTEHREKEGTVEASGKKNRGTDSPTRSDRGRFFLGLGGGMFKSFTGAGSVLGIGYGGKLMLQCNNIVEGFGIEAEGGYWHLPDRDLRKSYIRVAPVVLSPRYRFSTEFIDIHLSTGAGFSYTRSRLDLLWRRNDFAFDPVVAAGAGLSHAFGGLFVIGVEVKYYCIIEKRPAHSISAGIFLGFLL